MKTRSLHASSHRRGDKISKMTAQEYAVSAYPKGQFKLPTNRLSIRMIFFILHRTGVHQTQDASSDVRKAKI